MSEIDRWQEAISTMPDKQFFSTMRLYLGEIKTPYNKQRLIEQLAGFIKNAENTAAMLALLDNFDVQILTAISLIPKATKEVLTDFFSSCYTFTDIYTELINLQDRLLIYAQTEEYTGKKYLYINPLLQDKLQPYLNIKLLLPDTKTSFYSMEDVFTLSPNYLLSFISYIKIKGISCKADGTIKKNDQTRLQEIFPAGQKRIQLLMNAFINLSIVRENEKGFTIDSTKLQAFTQLPLPQQTALLCAAAVSRFSKEGLKKETQLLLDSLSSIPETGYTRQTILRLAFLVGTHTEDGSALAKKSRFSQILEAARGSAGDDPVQNANLLDRMIDAAIEFGLLQNLGKDDEANQTYIKNPQIFQQEFPAHNAESLPKVLNIDSTYTVTLMPGLQLKDICNLSDFLLIRKTGVVTEFELTKQAAAISFDHGWTPEKIVAEIEKFTAYPVPENLKININEWYNNYSSAMLYYGYVLKVTDTNINFVENNPNVQKYIKEKLAEGIYLLNIPVGADISEFIEESSLEFLGNMRQAENNSDCANFPLLRPGRSLNMSGLYQGDKVTSVAAADKILKSLKEKLAAANFDKNQTESLTHRISNRLILTEKQLLTASIRTEILEADGMDFSGKVHLIDAAIKEEDMMELQMPTPNGDGGFFTLVGKPLLISKQPGEAIVRIQLEPTHDIETILVSRITHLRRLRY